MRLSAAWALDMIRRLGRWVLPVVLVGSLHPPVTQAELLTDLTLEHDGVQRFYDLRVPDGPVNEPRALVLDLHGVTLTKEDQRSLSNWESLASLEEFYVAWPNALENSWNTVLVGGGPDDVGFLSQLVAHLVSAYDIDANRIYATGFSQGGGMVFRLACQTSNLFAAYATIAQALGRADAPRCEPEQFVPILSVHGTTDNVVPYDGDFATLSAVENFEFWRGKNLCAGPVERNNLGAEAWCDTDRNCAGSAHTRMCAVTGSPSPHFIYNNTAKLDLTDLAWTFFQQFALDGESGFEINQGLNDAWFNPDTNGQGFFIIVFEDIPLVFLAWFTYDTERPDGTVTANLGDPGHRWITAQGPFEENVGTLDAVITRGGVFDSGEPEPENEIDGTMTVIFESCTKGTVSYNIPSLGLMGVVPIQRIANDNVALCESLAN